MRLELVNENYKDTHTFFRHRPGNRGPFHLTLGVDDDARVVLRINSVSGRREKNALFALPQSKGKHHLSVSMPYVGE